MSGVHLDRVQAWCNASGELFLTVSDDRIRDDAGRKKELVVPVHVQTPRIHLRRLLEAVQQQTEATA